MKRSEERTTTDDAFRAAPAWGPRIATLENRLAASEQAIPHARWAIEEQVPLYAHLVRVARRSLHLAARLNHWAGTQLVVPGQVGWAGLLHDLGKLWLPSALCAKPGPLTEAEWRVLRQHPGLGAAQLPRQPWLRCLQPAIRHHHERWDGQGYPNGIARAAIPLAARLLAVVDALDAMTSQRPYQARRPFAAAWAELERGANQQWDPVLVALVGQWQGTLRASRTADLVHFLATQEWQ